ncbi:hypothetical protein [Methylocystis echinoides]|uniref:hypothetical protein n=1 Tax=Methylocystis echinoides TaxID=29468 RepID=UPI0034417BEB
MKLFVLAVLASSTVIATAAPALAKVPPFAAKCPMDIVVETDRAGRAYVSGKKASVRSKNANYFEVRGAGVTISVARDAGSLIVTYTGAHGANGVCQVTEQETLESAAPAPARADDGVPARDKGACLRAVKKKTNNPKVTVVDAISSEANNTVTIGVGPERAPWRCLVKRGVVADVMSQTNEGGL